MLAPANMLGRARRADDARGRYIEFAKRSFPADLTLEGLRIVIDAAHGAMHEVAPRLFYELGADVDVIHAKPDGRNINRDCGSLHPETMQARVLERRADLGVAFDGDGDRVILCDERGRLLTGDHLLYICALHMAAKGTLRQRTVVGTSMTNMALEEALREKDVQLVRTDVGDRYVVECMRNGGFNLGGEPCGHLIFLDYHSTADGLVTTLQLLAVMRRSRCALSELAASYKPYRQSLLNVPVRDKPPLEDLPAVAEAVDEVRSRLGQNGRLVVRYSGTEMVARALVEARDGQLAGPLAEQIAGAIRSAIGRL